MDSRLTRAAGGASEDLESMEGGWGESNLHAPGSTGLMKEVLFFREMLCKNKK